MADGADELPAPSDRADSERMMTPRTYWLRLRQSRTGVQMLIGGVLLASASALAMASHEQRGAREAAGETVAAVSAPSPATRLSPAVHPAADPDLGRIWSLSHDLIVPVAGVEPSDLHDTFRQARGGDRQHEGIDILAPRGTPVLAATDGVILRLADHDSGGITLYQVAPDGQTVFYYAHLDSYASGVTVGATVRQGDIIAYVGDTGNAGPGNHHLHFEVLVTPDPSSFWAARPRNPYPLLTRARG